MTHRRPVSWFALCVLVMTLPLIWSCQLDDGPQRSNIGGPVVDPGEEPRQIQMPLDDAPCTIHVVDYGDINIEDDYIPNVVACENGNAPMEALKAQAVQARGYIYYKLFIAGDDSVVNSQADQVYDCDYASANERHYAAAEATRGQILEWNDQIIASFYVAGAIPANQDSGSPADGCEGAGGNDPTDTEQWVTYNQGLTGCDITMTPLGWVPDDCHDNPQNRGCASQNGQTCLANRGWDYDQMLPYYYGDDIQLETVGGSCGGPGDPEPSLDHRHCEETDDDGWSCRDSRRVQCSGDIADDAEDCPHGCDGGQCQDPPIEDVFCQDEVDEDGWVCLDDDTRVNCEDDQIVATDHCTAGCEDDECLPADDNGDNGDGDDDQGDNGDDDEGSGDDTGESTGEVVSLVTKSPGIEGGCTTSGAGPALGPAVAVVVLMLLAAIRRDSHSRYLVP